MAKTFKKLILIDLDGVLNQYAGKYEKTDIPPINPGADVFLRKVSQSYDIKIFTTKHLTTNWLKQNDLLKYVKDVTNIKEPAFLYIDDRRINFDNDFNRLEEKINNFKPHWAS